MDYLKQEYKLYPHQEEALEWLNNLPNNHGMRGGIVSYTMGLGKTLLGLVYAVDVSRKLNSPSLVICPKTVMYEWMSNSDTFLQNVNIVFMHTDFNKKSKKLSWKDIEKTDVVVTTYDTCLSGYRSWCSKNPGYKEYNIVRGEDGLLKDKIIETKEMYNAYQSQQQRDNAKNKRNTGIGYELIFSTFWSCVISDESQRFANPRTKTYGVLMSIYGERKCCLTGTPIRNYNTDLWAQLRYLGFTKIYTARQWTRTQRHFYRMNPDFNQTYINSKKYEDVGIEMPPLMMNRILIPLQTEEERYIYGLVLEKAKEMFESFMKRTINFSNILAMFIRLRQVCIASFLLFPESKRKDTEKECNSLALLQQFDNNTEFSDHHKEWLSNIETSSGMASTKVARVVEIVTSLESDEKILIFSMFTSCLDLIKKALEKELPDQDIMSLDGSVTGLNRYLELHEFKNDPTKNIMLIHYKVGSEGLNIPQATHVIFVEPWWTDAVHSQALARAWRNGQKKTVTVHQIIIKNTIEEKIISICNEKNDLVKSLLGENSTLYMDSKNMGLTSDMIRNIIYTPYPTEQDLEITVDKIKLY